jgi:hypothetical protein
MPVQQNTDGWAMCRKVDERFDKTSVFASGCKKWITLCDGLSLTNEESEANAAFIRSTRG